MPQINDPNAQEALAVLRTYVEQCGGEGSAIDGWTTELYSRSIGNSAGTTDRYFFDASGKKFRSRAEIARALGLSGAPAIRVKGDGTQHGSPMTGEAPATFKYEWGDQTERTSKKAPLRSRATRNSMVDIMGAGCPHGRRQPRWRDVLENQRVACEKGTPTQSSEAAMQLRYDLKSGGRVSKCTSQSRVVRNALDCCMGGAPDPLYVHHGSSLKFDKVRDRKGLKPKWPVMGGLPRRSSATARRMWIGAHLSRPIKVQVHHRTRGRYISIFVRCRRPVRCGFS